ncbi:MAG: DUF1700 domain-containing protein [Clostridia bacterium]|nr:DUF1700 domain-containing protein [Clostridia bacterium]
MTKLNFILELQKRLSSLPQEELEERLSFYMEMIEDRMEDGLSEEEAVADIGNIDEIADQIIADIPLSSIVKKKVRPTRKMKAWETALLWVGSPVWIPLLIAAIAVALSLYAVLWSVIASLWAVFVSFCACALAGLAAGVGAYFFKNLPIGAAFMGAGLVLAGLSIFMFFACTLSVKGAVILTKAMILGTKKSFMGKETAK